ncbi:unnamed protein product [Moneuplotes crassus]|uniref:Uncharacterized protein n=1 Tax=Euplotes crassus TaxID=5936 RepID=A0AAD1UG97_EUPCR|nr:unnamed protein product [Moneuplotes crassus]
MDEVFPALEELTYLVFQNDRMKNIFDFFIAHPINEIEDIRPKFRAINICMKKYRREVDESKFKLTKAEVLEDPSGPFECTEILVILKIDTFLLQYRIKSNTKIEVDSKAILYQDDFTIMTILPSYIKIPDLVSIKNEETSISEEFDKFPSSLFIQIPKESLMNAKTSLDPL